MNSNLISYLLAQYEPKYQASLDIYFVKRIVVPIQRVWRRRPLSECPDCRELAQCSIINRLGSCRYCHWRYKHSSDSP